MDKRQKNIEKILRETGALILDTHVVYTSGRHGNSYFNKDAIYPHTGYISKLCKMMALNIADKKIDIVVGPAYGGIVLSHSMAAELSKLRKKDILGVYAEKGSNGSFVFRRGYDKLVKDQNVLVVEDVLNTGQSARKVVDLCKSSGAYVVGLSVLINRGNVNKKDVGNVEINALIEVVMDSWEENECDLCRSNVPIYTDIGKGLEFVQKRAIL